jgi:hypothetical protein
MGAYDSHQVTLDPGLTALALRGLHEREGHYPFLDAFARRGRSSRRARPARPVASALRRLIPWHFFWRGSAAPI